MVCETAEGLVGAAEKGRCEQGLTNGNREASARCCGRRCTASAGRTRRGPRSARLDGEPCRCTAGQRGRGGWASDRRLSSFKGGRRYGNEKCIELKAARAQIADMEVYLSWGSEALSSVASCSVELLRKYHCIKIVPQPREYRFSCWAGPWLQPVSIPSP